METKVPIVVAEGDGIGPEIMAAVLSILAAARAPIEPIFIDIGKKMFQNGHSTGIPPEAWAQLRQHKIFLKAPITTPLGGGYKSLNVTLRKALGLYANIRPTKALAPIIPTHFPKMDLVIIRENVEDVYAGIEYRQTHDTYQCLKLISRSGSERIVRFAFEYAVNFNRKKVTCILKDNIMKLTDGIFHKVFDEIGAQYPGIQKDFYLMDIGSAYLATDPGRFDVIVTENMYGDILSDVAAQLVGSVGLAGSANFGTEVAIFEAIHGSAPDIAGQDKANPSGLLNAAIQLLRYINAHTLADTIENAWLKTLEDGLHTGDIAESAYTKKRVGTQEFAQEIIKRLGSKPILLMPCPVKTPNFQQQHPVQKVTKPLPIKKLIGADVFVDRKNTIALDIAEIIANFSPKLKLNFISSLGIKVWPNGFSETNCSDHWRCQFIQKDAHTSISLNDIIHLLTALHAAGIDVIKMENLFKFDEELGFTLAQGQ